MPTPRHASAPDRPAASRQHPDQAIAGRTHPGRPLAACAHPDGPKGADAPEGPAGFDGPEGPARHESRQSRPRPAAAPAARDGQYGDRPQQRCGDRSGERYGSQRVTQEGAAWLVSAGTYPRCTLTRWTSNPTVPLVLPCGVTFDVVSAPAAFGRRLLDQLWEDGPGSGPVAVQRGRVLLFAQPGTAQRLPSLLRWEEWGTGGHGGDMPPLLCHGGGDAVTVPPLAPDAAGGTVQALQALEEDTPQPRWLAAPGARRPWLPGPDVLLWACVRAVRAAGAGPVPAGARRGA